MGTVIVQCDACETKNKIDESKIETARCGRCRNPLQDAIEEQLGIGKEPQSGSLFSGTNKATPKGGVLTMEDLLKNLFGG